MKRHLFLYALPTLMVAFFISAFFMLLIRTASENRALTEMTSQVEHMTNVLKASSQTVYGTVVSVDSKNSTIVLRHENRYEVDGPWILTTLHVGSRALVGKQELLKSTPSQTTYDKLSPIGPLSLNEIRAGEHAAAIIGRDEENVFQVYVLLVGNPL